MIILTLWVYFPMLRVFTENDAFDAYYRAQGFIRDQDDWDSFKSHLCSPLPACFRLNINYECVEKLRSELLEFVGTKIEATETSPEVEAVVPLPWCPNAYKMAVDKRAIRRQVSLKSFQFLVFSPFINLLHSVPGCPRRIA